MANKKYTEKSSLNRLSNTTLQEQLCKELIAAIRGGKFKPGESITSELKLSEEYGISRVTVRRSIQQLVDEGYLIKRKGKGTFVKPKIYTEEIYKGGSFTDNCLNRNATPSTQIIECKKTIGNPEILSLFNSSSDSLIEVTRIRKVDDVPCIIEIDYFPESFDFLLNMDIKDTSLLKLITNTTGIVPSKFIDKFTISYASKEYANYLDCPVRTPLLLVTQEVRTTLDDLIYVNKQFILTSKYIYVKS